MISRNIKEHWEFLTESERREFLTQFVKKIVIVNRSTDRHKGIPEILNIEFYND